MSQLHPSRHPSRAIRNIALVPACLLPYKDQWQALANTLPAGSILMCLPTHDELHQGMWDDVVRSMRAMGHHVLTIPLEHFLHPPSPPHQQCARPAL
jgi:hypothetical protein